MLNEAILSSKMNIRFLSMIGILLDFVLHTHWKGTHKLKNGIMDI